MGFALDWVGVAAEEAGGAQGKGGAAEPACGSRWVCERPTGACSMD